MPETYIEGLALLQSQPGQWLSEPRCLWLSSLPAGKYHDSTWNRPWPLPSKSFPAHCSPVILQIRDTDSIISLRDLSDPCRAMEAVYTLQHTGSNAKLSCDVSFQPKRLRFYQLLMDLVKILKKIISLFVLQFHKLYFKHSSCTLIYFVCMTVDARVQWTQLFTTLLSPGTITI
jgi:hypothetical protein